MKKIRLNYRHTWWLYKTRRRFYNKLLKNFKHIRKLLINFFLLNINSTKKNIFLNLSNLFNGNLLMLRSAGMSKYSKNSLKKTYTGVEFLFRDTKINIKNYKKSFLFLNIRGLFFYKGLKFHLYNFLTFFEYRVYKINNIMLKAHNGVKIKAKRRR